MVAAPSSSTSLSILLTEPHVFVTVPPRRDRQHLATEGNPPSLVRALLILTLAKAAKVTSIEVSFEGKSVTDWPEGELCIAFSALDGPKKNHQVVGIGPRRLETTEQRVLVSGKSVFFDATSSSSRRARSVGPGTRPDADDYATPPLSRQPSNEQPPSFNAAVRSSSVMPSLGGNVYHPSPASYTPQPNDTSSVATPPYTPTPSRPSHSHQVPSPPRTHREGGSVTTSLELSRHQLRHDIGDTTESPSKSDAAIE